MYLRILLTSIISVNLFAAPRMSTPTNPFTTHDVQESRLCFEAFKGNLNEVKRLVEEEKISVNCKNNDGRTPLLQAIAGELCYSGKNDPSHDRIGTVAYLLQRGAHVGRHHLYHTYFAVPLEWAVTQMSVPLCALLLAADANGLEQPDNVKYATVLEYAQQREQRDLESHTQNPDNIHITKDYIASKKIRNMIEKKCALDARKFLARPAVIAWRHLHPDHSAKQ